MKISVAIVLALLLGSCAPRVVYVDRPAASTPPANNNDNQAYQPPVNNNPPQTNPQYSEQQYNNNQQQPNNNGNYTYKDDSYNQPEQQYVANQQQVNYGAPSCQTFYDDLAPYGSWVSYPGYGNVWMPAQGPDFRPYASNGQWVYTQYGWTWSSGYSWGWAPFHYGRWMEDPSYGWLWIPGNTWAPAWVTWGQYNGYYGWAPVGPNVYSYEGYRPPANEWNFVPQNHIVEPNVSNYLVSHTTNNVIVNNQITNVTVINNVTNNTTYNAGPKVENVETVTGHHIAPASINATQKPVAPGKEVNGNSISIYRPEIPQSTMTTATPAHVVPINSAKAINATAHNGVLPRQVNNSPKTNEQPVRPNEPVKPSEPMRVNQFHPTNTPRLTEMQPERTTPQHTQPSEPERPNTTEPVRPSAPARPNAPEPVKPEQPAQYRPTAPQPVQQPPAQYRPTAPQPASRPVKRPQQLKPTPKPQPEKKG